MNEETFWQWIRSPEKRDKLYDLVFTAIIPTWVSVLLTLLTVRNYEILLLLLGTLITAIGVCIFLVYQYYEFRDLMKPLPVPFAVFFSDKPTDESARKAIVKLLREERKRSVQKFSEDRLVIPFEWILKSGKLTEPDNAQDIDGMKNSANEFQAFAERIDDWVSNIDMIKTVAEEKRIYIFFKGPLPIAFYLGNSLQNKKFFLGKWVNNRYELLGARLAGGEEEKPFQIDSYELKKIGADCENYLDCREEVADENGDPYSFDIYVAVGHHGNLTGFDTINVIDDKSGRAKRALIIKRKGTYGEGSVAVSDIPFSEYVNYAVCISNKIKKFCESVGRCEAINLFLNTTVEIAILMGYMLKPPPAIYVYHYKDLSKGSFYYSVLRLTKE